MKETKLIKKESAGGLIYSNHKFLLIKDLDTGLYEIPKGGLHIDETKEDACIREIREETGYDVKVLHYLSTTRFILNWRDGKTYDKIIHYYLLQLTDDNQIPKPNLESDENFENIWLSYKDALSKLTHEDAIDALNIAKSKIDSNNL